MMKKYFIIIYLSLVGMICHSQTCNTHNMFIVGDQLSQIQISYPTFEEQTGTELVWKMKNKIVIQPNIKTAFYSIPDSTSHNLIGMLQGNISYIYELTNDTIKNLGFDTHTTSFKYKFPRIIQLANVAYGQSICNLFYGKGIYAEKDSFCIYGNSDIKVDSKGTFVTEDGDSIYDCLKQHSINNLTCIFANQDSTHFRLIEDKWFASGFRYPILETKQFLGADGEELFSTALVTPITNQKSLSDETNEKLRLKREKETYSMEVGTKNIITNQQIKLNYKEGILDICYYNPSNQNLSYGLYTENGITLYHKPSKLYEKGIHKDIVKIKLNKSGVYIFQVIKGKEKQSLKFSIK